MNGPRLFDFTMIVVSLVIGMGIFRTRVNVARDAPSAALATTQSVTLSPGMNQYLTAFGRGLVLVSFTYGYQQTINFGGEVRNPARNLPCGIFLGIAPIIALCLFPGVPGYGNALLRSNRRVLYAMSEDGILPPAFRQRHPRTGVLVVSLTIFALLCMLIVGWAQKFGNVLGFSIFLDCFGMILSAGSIFLLRRRTRHLNETGIYKMNLYPLQPVLFILAYLFVAISLLKQQTLVCLVGLGVMSVFVALCFLVFSRTKTSMDVRRNTTATQS